MPASLKDAVSSLAGDEEMTCFAFREAGCTGHYFGIAANTHLPVVPADMNDVISSVMCPDQRMD